MSRASGATPDRSARFSRRDFLAATATSRQAIADDERNPPKQIAAVVTAFRYRSHAHGIAGRWLEGFDLDGQSEHPSSQLVACFIEQMPKNDIGRALCEKHGFPSIRRFAIRFVAAAKSLRSTAC